VVKHDVLPLQGHRLNCRTSAWNDE